METILEFMKYKLKCDYISDLRNVNKVHNIVEEVLKLENQFSMEEIVYLLRYINSQID